MDYFFKFYGSKTIKITIITQLIDLNDSTKGEFENMKILLFNKKLQFKLQRCRSIRYEL